MHIVHIYKTYMPEAVGGCEQMIKTIVQATMPFGCTHQLLTTRRRQATPRIETRDGMQICRYRQTVNWASCPISLSLTRDFKKQLARADIVHYHFPWPYAEALHVLADIKKPTIVSYHSDIIRQKFLKKFYTPIMQAFLKRVNYIVPASENFLGSSGDLVKYINKCTVIPYGLNEHDYFPVDNNRLAYYEKNIGKNFILFVGMLRYYKGLNYLLDAVANTDIKLVIAGSGPMEQTLKQQASRLQLKNIHFIGRVSEIDKAALLQLCRAVVLPSHLRAEAFGIVLLEGLLFGKPLISTDLNTGTSFVNKDGVTGIVVKPGDIGSLRSAIQLLYTNTALANQMGQAAHEYYKTYFTAEKMGATYYEIYKHLHTSIL